CRRRWRESARGRCAWPQDGAGSAGGHGGRRRSERRAHGGTSVEVAGLHPDRALATAPWWQVVRIPGRGAVLALVAVAGCARAGGLAGAEAGQQAGEIVQAMGDQVDDLAL